MKLAVKVVPKSSRDGVSGWLGDALKVRVRAAAERGKANAAVERLIAHALDIPAASVLIVTGKTSPRKVVQINGLSESEVHKRLLHAPSPPRRQPPSNPPS